MATFVRSSGPDIWEPGDWNDGERCVLSKVLGDWPAEFIDGKFSRI